MGLLDNPVGFVFGEDPSAETVDRRKDRTSEGKRWWQQWKEIYQNGGNLDPGHVMNRAYDVLNKGPVQITSPWGSFPVYPRSQQRQSQAYLGLLDPWYNAGMMLEGQRLGQAVYNPGQPGLLGNFLDNAAGSLGRSIGGGVGYGIGRKLGLPSS